MGFWDLGTLQLEEFRPGIKSKAEFGDNLIMVCMEIGAEKEDTGHKHTFDQYLNFFGTDKEDLKDFGAEIELCLGEEQEKHIIKRVLCTNIDTLNVIIRMKRIYCKC